MIPEAFLIGKKNEAVHQSLYDRLSYDDVLFIEHSDPEIRFTYEDDYLRIFHTDGRRRRSTANDFFEGGGTDWSEGGFEGGTLVVEARPRDGGYTIETYSLVDGGNRLRIDGYSTTIFW